MKVQASVAVVDEADDQVVEAVGAVPTVISVSSAVVAAANLHMVVDLEDLRLLLMAPVLVDHLLQLHMVELLLPTVVVAVVDMVVDLTETHQEVAAAAASPGGNLTVDDVSLG